jgi:hypothetical protein
MSCPESGSLIGRRLVKGEWYGVYQVPSSLMTERDVSKCEDAGMGVESLCYSHHSGGSWWRVTWLPTVASALWTRADKKNRDAFMALPEM